MSVGNNIQLDVIQDGGKMIVTHPGLVYFSPEPEAQKVMTTPPVPEWENPGWRWAYWGVDDRLPTNMRQKIEAVPIAGRALKKNIDMLCGNGVIYYKTADLAKGNEVERAFVPEIEMWLDDNRIQTEWLPAQAADYSLPMNCFSEMILSNDRKSIAEIYHISAEHGRLSKANPVTNQVDWLLYSYHFPWGTAESDGNRIAMPLYRWYNRAKFFDNLRGMKFGWHTRFPTPGLIYYGRAPWLGLFKDGGWLDVSADVPKIVRAMQKNQIQLKYVINIPDTYFLLRYPDWNTYDTVKRDEIIDKKIAALNKYLQGSDNLYKSISNIFKESEINGTATGKITIEAVDDKTKSGTWVPDSSAADAQIVQALGIHPSQIGLAPEGGKMGAGSGSDQRETYNLHITLNTLDQRLLLEPLNTISKYNKWGVTFAIDHTNHTTTNQQESGLQPSKQSTVVKPAAG